MDGFLIIDKPYGITSRDVVNKISKIYHTKKVGHSGTLDPIATGVLVICVNRATKLAELVTGYDKEYIATFEFGTLTDTLDITGNILKSEDCRLDKEDLLRCLENRTCEYDQEVPIYSAVKVNGKKLYEYAREGENISLPKHRVNIKSIELIDIKYIDNKTIVKIKCEVSKGTYIRSLGNDIAEDLGTYATMTSLIRTRQGNFDIKDAINLDLVSENLGMIDIMTILKEYKTVSVSSKLENQISNGMVLNNEFNANTIFFVNSNGNPLALYKEYEKDSSKLKPWKTFY